MFRWLQTVLVIWAVSVDMSLGFRIYKSRKKAMSMLSGATAEAQHYFSSCDQSSLGQSCRLAMDNDVTSEWSQCANTAAENNTMSWWRGYLENPMYISTVFIQNADWQKVGDTDGLLEFTISGNGYVCYTHSAQASFASKSFPCDILADDIEIKTNIEGAVLSICEVQVFGSELKFKTVLQSRVGMVPFDHCIQSSTDAGSHCWHAIDRYLSQNASLRACAMTSGVKYEWWRAVLTVPAIVREVIIINRNDCCQEKLTNFAITVGKRPCARYNKADKFGQKLFTCNQFGGFITIQQMTNDALTLCEVEVSGHQVDMLAENQNNATACVLDKVDDPTMGAEFSEPVSVYGMSRTKCDRMCRRLKTKYFGLRDGHQCWCGNTFGKHGLATVVTECGMYCDSRESVRPQGCELARSCEGKPSEFCGGKERLAVFEIL